MPPCLRAPAAPDDAEREAERHPPTNFQVPGTVSHPALPAESFRADLPSGCRLGLIEAGFSHLRLLSPDPRDRNETKASWKMVYVAVAYEASAEFRKLLRRCRWSSFRPIPSNVQVQIGSNDDVAFGGNRRKRGTQYQAIGRSRGGLTTKIVALVDALGNLVRFLLLPGQAHDMKGVAPLIRNVPFGALLADKAFDANWLLQELDPRGATAVIPPKANRKHQREYDAAAYK